ncbi:MAG: hypothetical protein KBT04_05125 [Bacteroidales bacterium]|nr:hypothetical protein [Candidatus Colimorpha onthohippi]
MKKIILSLFCLASTVFAVAGPGSSLEVGGRMGIGALLPVTEFEVDYTPAFAGGFDLNYTYMFNDFFGFTTGVNISFLNSSIASNNILSHYSGEMTFINHYTNIAETKNVRCVGKTESLREEYKATFFEIPLFLAIHNDQWYYNIGYKIGVPIKMNADFDRGPTTMMVDYIYDYGGYSLEDNPLPIDDATDPGTKGDYDVYKNRSKSVFLLFALEIGYKFDVSNHGAISIGAYIDYGINNAQLGNPETSELLTLNGANVERYNGAMNSNLMTSVRYYKAGVRILYNLGFGNSHGGGGRHNKRLL